MYKGLIAIISLLLGCSLIASCAATPDFDSQLNPIVKPYLFSIAQWESRVIPYEVNKWISGRNEKIDDKVSVVTEYFSLVERINALKSDGRHDNSASLEAELSRLQEQKAALEDVVERIIAEQIEETLAELYIFHPVDNYIGLKVNFPPVNFELEKPPHLLVISPRHKIESMREITLRPDISLEEI